jgi:hypothetical protein
MYIISTLSLLSLSSSRTPMEHHEQLRMVRSPHFGDHWSNAQCDVYLAFTVLANIQCRCDITQTFIHL